MCRYLVALSNEDDENIREAIIDRPDWTGDPGDHDLTSVVADALNEIGPMWLGDKITVQLA